MVRAEAHLSIQQARCLDLLVAGGWGATVDIVAWLMGFEDMIVLTAEQPSFMRELLATIGAKASGRIALWGGVNGTSR